jgi:cellulose biosynthesis protein BcsQ
LTRDARAGYVFIVLFAGDDGLRVQQMLRLAINPVGQGNVTIELPPSRGAEFLSTRGAPGVALDEWWQHTVPAGALAIYLALEEEGLSDWIPGTAGAWFVGVADPASGRRFLEVSDQVFPVITLDPEVVAEQAMQAVGGHGEREPLFHPSFPYRHDPIPWPHSIPRAREHATALHEPSVVEYTASVPPRPWQPISYEIAPVEPPGVYESAPVPTHVPAATGTGQALLGAVARVQAGSTRLRGIVGRTSKPGGETPTTLGQMVNANRPIVAGFASRKGGVGKTTLAAATAATIGEALDGLPDTAALVDGNITNPDSWALNPAPGSATVRTLVSRLSQGLDPPAEEYASTPRLAIYPESRNSEELYTQAEVDLVAEYLRRRHSFIAVDLPNALPSLTSGGPGAVAAAWLVHCDVIVLPFNADPRARQGLIEYMDMLGGDRELEGKPVLAPYIVSANRSISSDPAVQADIDQVRRKGAVIAEIPDDQNALLALLRDLPINQASPRLRAAYLRMTQTLVEIVTGTRARR